MKGRLPIGPFDAAFRMPMLCDCDLQAGRVSEAAGTALAAPATRWLAFEGLTPDEGAVLASRVCARAGVHHAAAFCEAVEAAAGLEVSMEHHAWRVILSEWARIASHLEVVSDVARCLQDDITSGPPRRYLLRIRESFNLLCSDPFASGAIVPGGVSLTGDTSAVDSMSEAAMALKKDASMWQRKLRLSGPRLSSSHLDMKDIPDEHPPAPAFRASGSELDVRSGDDAPGFYAEAGYSPVVRTGGTPLDRALVLLGEVVSSLELIDKAHEVADYGGPPEARALGAGSGSGLWESSHGGLEYRVFLASDGRLSRVRPASAADVVAELVGPALKGAPFEDVAPALVSLNMCVSCSTA